MKSYFCFYCNANADTQDHCPSLSHAQNFSDYDRVLLRACFLCNSMLSDRFLLTPFKRLEYLKSRYLKRWRRDLDMPSWSDDEIQELEGTLKDEIIRAMKRKERAVAVISNIQQRIDIFLEAP
jgi:hypothetical protein